MSSTAIHRQAEPVAIVGMGCRWAGGIRDATGLWELLKNNREGWKKFDNPHFSVNALLHDNPDRPGSLTTEGAYLLEEDARLFDHSFFGITGREVETMDPSQRKILEVVYEAFENAGETLESIAGSRTGVYIGNFSLDHLLTQSRDWESPRPYAATGVDTSILANRVSYIFNLNGPSLTMNTACSSSMYALHMAVSAIRSGDCDGAIVAAGNWISDPAMQFLLDKLGALSPTSRCHTFDAAADGYARGEGFAALYLKKTDLAVLEGLPIRAMIRGTAVNANGRTGGITRPSASGQVDVIHKAYENAGNLPLADTHVFECHGTGTPVGDPLEVAAVGNVFASSRKSASPQDRMLVGSIKPNLGHTEGASAIASIMKVVMSLESGVIAPTYGVENLNPNIDFDGARVEVVTDTPRPWPEGKLRRISVNSFGFGGANGHAIIDHVHNVLPGYVKPGVITRSSQHPGTNGHTNGHINGHINGHTNGHTNVIGLHPQHQHSPIIKALTKSASANASTRQHVLLAFSAHTESSLKSNIHAISEVASQWPLADLAYTLGCKRSRLSQRSFRIVNKDAPRLGLETEQRIFTSQLQTANIGFVFTGQGAQWHGMGAQLFSYSVFKDAISYLDAVLASLPGPRPSWTLSDVLSGACEPSLIQTPEVSQAACTAVQIGIVDLLASWSVRPAAVVGHSSGEMAAAYASGCITAAEAITAAYFRGQAVAKNTKEGAMLAVALTTEEALAYLVGREEHIKIGAINSPKSLTLSGDADDIQALAGELTKAGIFNRVLRTGGNAYHSHHMAALGSSFSDMLSAGIEHINKLGFVNPTHRYPSVPWISSVTPGKSATSREIPVSYWRANLESPVRFSQAVTAVMNLQDQPAIDILLEIGPHAALKSPLDEITKGIKKPAQYLSALKRNEDCQVSVLQLAGALFGLNAGIDMAAVNSVDMAITKGESQSRGFAHGCTAFDLPIYQYTYGPVIYYESRPSKELRLRDFPRHDLLGSRIPGASKLQPQWRNILRVKDLPWLADHRLIPDVVFPGAGFIAMAIEAASQGHRVSLEAAGSTTSITGYSLRNVDIKTALRIPEDDEGIEVVLSMEPVDSTIQPSSWAKFTISSVSRDLAKWTEHCTGQIKIETQQRQPREINKVLDVQMDARTPNLASWYDKFTDIGLGYGPTFQPLSKLESDPRRQCARAYVDLGSTRGTVKGGESPYDTLHPAALDATFQLGIIACYGGQVDKATASYVPVYFNEIYLRSRAPPELIEGSGLAAARGKMQGLRDAMVDIQMADHSGNVMLEIGSLRLTQFTKSALVAQGPVSERPFSSPFTRLVWQPDIRTLSNSQGHALFPPAYDAGVISQLQNEEYIGCLVVADIYDNYLRGRADPESEGELRHWISWARRCYEHDLRGAMRKARELSPDQRQQQLQALLATTGHTCSARAAQLIHANIGDIIHGRRSGIDTIVAEEGLLAELYLSATSLCGAWPQLQKVLDCLGHVNPNQRIIEIGAGTGSGTRIAMKALAGANGIKRYADYTFTDISAGFLASAQETMAEYPDFHFSVLNIEEDPIEKGYEPESYDVVLAVESIHATTNMDATLSYCRSLLKPGGKLVLVETTEMKVLSCLLFGTFTGFWAGVNDNRSEGPFMDEAKWDSRLRNSGFSGTDLVLYDYPHPDNVTSVIMSTRIEKEEEHNPASEAEVYLLHDGINPPELLTEVAKEMQRGAKPVVACLNKALELVSANAHVLAFLSIQEEFCTDEHRLKTLQHLAKNTSSMIWLTSSGAVKGHDPRGAFMAGLLRAVAGENPAGRFVSIDVEADDFRLEPGQLRELVRNITECAIPLQSSDWSSLTSQDTEFTWQDGSMWVSRLVPDAGLATYMEADKTPQLVGSRLLRLGNQGPVRAAFETPGLLASIYFRPYTELSGPLPADYIAVNVAAVGLNWKDLSLTSGRFGAETRHLSSEYAGTVTRIGTNVSGLAVGDRVYGMGVGQFGNYTRVPAAFAHRLQSSDTFEQVATMPLVYMTAVYALEYLAHLRRGQSVLIQSASGGLGLAAIQIARYKGAEIFVTASGSNKIAFLADTVGIPPQRIFASRDPTALSRAAELAGKGGFNVILSTAQRGDDLADNLKALAPGGQLVDMSRMHVLDAKVLGLELFQKNASFHSFDLNMVVHNDPELGTELIETVDRLYRGGHITPIPCSVTDISALDQTLQTFSKGAHVGKFVVSFQDPDSLIRISSQPPQASFDPEARYILTGGLGGLGRSIICWMADRGACDFVVLSRRGIGSTEAQLLVDDLRSRNLRFESIICDVSNRTDVIAAVEKVKSTGRLVKGIVHAALSLTDVYFESTSIEQWQSGIAAKTLGTINLHEAATAAGLPLDFFVMTTTTETVWTPATQAAYVAASNFQEYFARYRRRLGLPASTVAYGLVKDVKSDFKSGAVGTEDMMMRMMAQSTTEWQVLASLDPAFLQDSSSSSWFGQNFDPLSTNSIFTCLDPAALATMSAATVTPRWFSDSRASLIMRAMQDAQRQIAKSKEASDDDGKPKAFSATRVRQAFDEAIKAGEESRGSTVEFVTAVIVKTVAEMLFVDVQKVNPAKSVAAHGVDSLIAAELRHWFLQALATDLRMLDLLDAETSIRGLAEGIVSKALQC
ncbi:hypothetical protein B0I35DRAFT_454850 [Stachybotrys elegans]|uniref:Carrier domain-containing protein n=1 Tax=Stachybotrys elegans TaxID=80388 RepID=A0A8K0SED7_9HYPO|nr:hypothetical protein B0I35DRAFT_454850 [Stachybotrys elegans]